MCGSALQTEYYQSSVTGPRRIRGTTRRMLQDGRVLVLVVADRHRDGLVG
jgi:hypothetical protein